MSLTGRGVAVGVFADRSHAEYAVAELQRSGFTAEQIGFVVPDAPKGIEPPPLDPGTKAGEGVAAGVVAGGALGSLLGAALLTVAVPGIGPVLAGGLLAGILGGATVGAAGGGILGALIGANVPEEEARHYEREFHSGRTLVTVHAGDRYDEAAAILNREAETPEAKLPGTARGRLTGSAGGDATDGAGSAFRAAALIVPHAPGQFFRPLFLFDQFPSSPRQPTTDLERVWRLGYTFVHLHRVMSQEDAAVDMPLPTSSLSNQGPDRGESLVAPCPICTASLHPVARGVPLFPLFLHPVRGL